MKLFVWVSGLARQIGWIIRFNEILFSSIFLLWCIIVMLPLFIRNQGLLCGTLKVSEQCSRDSHMIDLHVTQLNYGDLKSKLVVNNRAPRTGRMRGNLEFIIWTQVASGIYTLNTFILYSLQVQSNISFLKSGLPWSEVIKMLKRDKMYLVRCNEYLWNED